LSEIVTRIVPAVFTAELGVRVAMTPDDLAAAQAALAVFRRVLFDKRHAKRIDDTPMLANIILNVYWMAAFEELSSVILDSLLANYTPEFAINLLKSMPAATKEEWGAASMADPEGVSAVAAAAHNFALGLLYLRIGDMQTTLKRLSRIAAFLQQQCIEKPGLLFETEVSDPMLPDVCAAQSGAGGGGRSLALTSLGRFLGDYAPAVLKDVLLGLDNRISVASGLRALLPTDEGRTAVYQVAIEYLSESLRAPTATTARSMTCTTFLTMLLVKQLERQSSSSSSSSSAAKSTSTSASTSGSSGGRRSPLVPAAADADGVGADVELSEEMELAWERERPGWLDHLPPFLSGASQLSSDVVATLKALQGLLFTQLDPANAPAVYTIIIKTHASTYPGRLSLELLCLPRMGRVDEGQRMLLRVYPSALLGYAKAFLPPRGTKKWDELLWKVLALVESRSSAKATANAAGRVEGGDAFVQAGSDLGIGGRAMTVAEIKRFKPMLNRTISPERYLATYTSLLSHVASICDPESFVALLPVNGNMAFYLPFIERSYRGNCANTIATLIETSAMNL